ncbi:hypothetical protein SAMN05192574_102411 [Mucilaginibacter gossypiicola]|uniref:Uncharacterized protein n=1 Tax=Mucilaginibacter gossypiicola TaxID=551995 RepID=A0A1H8DN86_9SPHI|nr:hypothetical protein SAMN05192574_102411 [Mucilaginibacter gossypiicola]
MVSESDELGELKVVIISPLLCNSTITELKNYVFTNF